MDAGFDWVVHQAEGGNSTYENVMGMIEDLSDEDYTDFCYEMDIDPEDMEELSSFVMRNYDSNRVMGFLKDRGMVEGYQAEARPISDDDELLAVYDDAGEHKGFIEMEDDEEEEAVEIDISDEEMNEIAEIKLGAEERSDDGIVYVDEDNSIRLAKGSKWMRGSGSMEDYYVDGCNSCHEKLDGYKTQYVVSPRERWAYCVECFDQMKGREDVIIHDAETFDAESKSMFGKDKNGKMYARRRNGEIITHNADFVKPSRDWLSLALGTAAVVIGGSLFLQNRGVFKADGDEEPAPVGTGEPSLVAHPSTGDLLPADYEEMIVESTGYAVPVIPVSLDPSFMGSRFHALPTDRVVESNEPGIGAHTDVAINRDTNYREPEQSLITEPPFAYRFNAEAACECSIFDKIKSFFTGKPCCVEEKEANSVTGQTPYFGVGFDGRNTQERVIKETNPVSLDPSVSPYLPLNLSGYTGQAYAPPTVYSSMMAVGETGQNPAFTSTSSSVGANRAGSRSVDSSTLQSVHGTLSAGVNQSYTDGSRTMSLSQWSIEYDVSQISDTEAFAVSRASGERSMIRRV